MTDGEKDLYYMRRALRLAEEAMALDEVPVGAVLVHRERILAEGFNLRECARMATRHAEIVALEEGCRRLGGWRLPDTVLYVTLEPCLMCAGAILNARIDRVVFGASDPKGGAFGGVTDASRLPFHHAPTVEGGILKEECAALLQHYFQKKRKQPSRWSGKNFIV